MGHAYFFFGSDAVSAFKEDVPNEEAWDGTDSEVDTVAGDTVACTG